MKRGHRQGGAGANLGATRIRRRSRAGDPMEAYDRLPQRLRAWLAQAALPWSAASARRAWSAALARTGGDADRALALLTEIEARQLARVGEAAPMMAAQGHGGPPVRSATAPRRATG